MRALSEAREQSKYVRRQLEEQIRTATEMREKAESYETKDFAINKSLRVINTEFNSVYSQYDSFMRDKTHTQDGSHKTIHSRNVVLAHRMAVIHLRIFQNPEGLVQNGNMKIYPMQKMT